MVFSEEDFIKYLTNSTVSADERLQLILKWAEINEEDYETPSTLMTGFCRLLDVIDVGQISKSAVEMFNSSNNVLRQNPDCTKHFNEVWDNRHPRMTVLMYGQMGVDRKTAVLMSMPQFQEGDPINISLPYLWFRSIASLNDKVYFVGGVSCDDDDVLPTVTVVDVQKGLVSEAPPLQTARKGPAVVAWSDEVFVCGGLESDDMAGKKWLASCERFTVGSESWRPMAPLKKAVQSAAAVIVFDCKSFLFKTPHILLTGGLDADGPMTDAVMFGLSVADIMWIAVTPMNHARWDHGIVLFNERVFVAGGQGSRNEDLTSVEMYTLSRGFCDYGQWTDLAPISKPSRWVSLAVFQNRLFAFDADVEEFIGETSTENNELISNERFKSFTWGPIENRPDDLRWCEGAVVVVTKPALAEKFN